MSTVKTIPTACTSIELIGGAPSTLSTMARRRTPSAARGRSSSVAGHCRCHLHLRFPFPPPHKQPQPHTRLWRCRQTQGHCGSSQAIFHTLSCALSCRRASSQHTSPAGQEAGCAVIRASRLPSTLNTRVRRLVAPREGLCLRLMMSEGLWWIDPIGGESRALDTGTRATRRARGGD